MGASIWENEGTPIAASGVMRSQRFVATAGQTVFTLTDFAYSPGTDSLLVFINGVAQSRTVDFVETSESVVTLVTGVEAGDIVLFVGVSVAGVQDGSDPVLRADLAASSGSSIVGYVGSGTGAVARAVQAKLRESVSVFDFMTAAQVADVIARTLVLDVTAAIQAAIDANGGKTIFFPAGSYRISAALTVSIGGTALIGAGNGSTFIFQYTPDTDGVTFAPATAGTTADFLSAVRIEGVNVAAAAAAYTTGVSGAGVRFTQCNGYRLFNCSVNNFPEGITIEGGQLGSLKAFQSYASAGSLPYAGSALLNFKSAPYGAGLYQRMFTVQVEDFRLSATKLRTSCVRIENSDGLNFGNGYIAFGESDLVRLVNTRDDSYIAAVEFANVYMDCVGPGNTPTAVTLPADAFANTFVYNVKIGSGCFLGNGDSYGVLVNKPEVMFLSAASASFVAFKKHAINFNVQGSGTLTDLHINGCQFQNCANDGTGSVLRAAGGRLLSVVGNTFSDCGSATAILTTAGTYAQGAVSGNVNGSNVADIGNSATYTNGYSQSGNASRFAKGGVSSWVGAEYTELGGLVIQGSASGKATTITLDTLEGQITTDAASLAAGATVRFTLNNSTIRAHDLIHVQRKSGGTGASYRMWSDFVSAGSCGICIQNITGAPLAEAIVLQFKVFRSAIT